MIVHVSTTEGLPGRRLYLWCPACDDLHCVSVDHPDAWAWDGDARAPSITPSIKVTGVQWDPALSFHKKNHAKVPPGETTTCHSFVTRGVWHYCDDSTHDSAGRSRACVPLPEGLFTDATA